MKLPGGLHGIELDHLQMRFMRLWGGLHGIKLDNALFDFQQSVLSLRHSRRSWFESQARRVSEHAESSAKILHNSHTLH